MIHVKANENTVTIDKILKKQGSILGDTEGEASLPQVWEQDSLFSGHFKGELNTTLEKIVKRKRKRDGWKEYP